MDDPPSVRANNTELIWDVLAIMFLGDTFRACLLYYGQSKNPTFCPIFFFFFFSNDRLPMSGICPPMCIGHRLSAWRSSDKMQDIHESVIVDDKAWHQTQRRRELRDLGMKRRSAWRDDKRAFMAAQKLCPFHSVGATEFCERIVTWNVNTMCETYVRALSCLWKVSFT